MSAPSLQKPSRAAALIAVVLFALLAPAGAEAKKKKKEDQGLLTGVVMNQAEELLVGVAVEVASSGDGGFSASATTDKKGEFSIEIPAEGDYVMRLAKEGYTTAEVTIPLVAGEKQRVQVKLDDASVGRRHEAAKAYNQGASAYEARDLATAKQHFLAALEADPSLAEPYLVLADIYLTEGAHQEAATAAEKFLELEPGDQKGQMLAYEAYQKLGNQEKAEELRGVLGQDAELASKMAIQVFNEGALANQKGELDTAIAKFKTALDLDPKLAEAHAALGAIYYNREQFSEARDSLDQALALKPDHVTSHRVSFLVHDALGDRAAADKAMAKYTELDPAAAADLLYQRADLDFRDNQPDLARSALLKVLELKPDHARAHYTLGKVYASTDTAKAKQYLQKFIELAPDDPEVETAKAMISYF